MKLSLIPLVSLPSAWAVSLAGLAYTPPSDAIRMADSSPECVLPRDYNVRNFAARSNDTGETLSSFEFSYADTRTNVTTFCQFNSSSTSTTPPGLTPRYSCANGEVKFIWEDDDSQLWMIERVCHGDDGVAVYEASGSMDINLNCNSSNGTCSSNSTAQTSLFTSFQPVRDPTVV